MGTKTSVKIVIPTLSAAVGIRSAFAIRRMSDPMLESKKQAKGNTMEKFSAVITSVANGVEYKTEVEDTRISHLHG
jgi:hypothetical protein